MSKRYYVYVLESDTKTLYIGVTNDLVRRMYEHKNHLADSFTKKYRIDRLIYYEEFNDIEEAITREKRLKKWNREWKLELIQKVNPKFEDLYPTIIT